MDIVVIHEDITALEVDAVVSPSTVAGEALKGSPLRVREIAGDEVSSALKPLLPLEIGKAVLTDAGGLRCKHLIHSAITETPLLPTSLEHLQKATLAAVQCAEQSGLKSVAIPDMDLARNMASQAKAARAMVAVLKGFDSAVVKRVLLVDSSVETVKVFESAMAEIQE